MYDDDTNTQYCMNLYTETPIQSNVVLDLRGVAFSTSCAKIMPRHLSYSVNLVARFYESEL